MNNKFIGKLARMINVCVGIGIDANAGKDYWIRAGDVGVILANPCPTTDEIFLLISGDQVIVPFAAVEILS